MIEETIRNSNIHLMVTRLDLIKIQLREIWYFNGCLFVKPKVRNNFISMEIWAFMIALYCT